MPLARWETPPVPQPGCRKGPPGTASTSVMPTPIRCSTARFIEGLLRHFGDGDEILLRHIGEDGAVDGLTIVEPSRPGTWSSFLPAQAQIAPLLVDRDRSLRCLPEPAACRADRPAVPGSWFSPGRNHYPPSLFRHHALTMGIALDGGFESYWQGRSRNLAANLRRYRHRIEKSGQETRFVRIEDPPPWPPPSPATANSESAGWKACRARPSRPGTGRASLSRDHRTIRRHRPAAVTNTGSAPPGRLPADHPQRQDARHPQDRL